MKALKLLNQLQSCLKKFGRFKIEGIVIDKNIVRYRVLYEVKGTHYTHKTKVDLCAFQDFDSPIKIEGQSLFNAIKRSIKAKYRSTVKISKINILEIVTSKLEANHEHNRDTE